MKAIRPNEELRYVGLRYMTRFRCIGTDCEDSCCGGWSVTVDPPHVEALREAMSGTEEERAEFAAAVYHRDDDGHRVSLLVQHPDKDCVMLGADQLCTIQRRYGESLLPDDCAVYPRSIGQINGRVELSGNLSCPEAARLCLLGEGATDLVPIDPALVTRGLIHYTYEDSPQDISEAVLDDIRALAQDLLSVPRYGLDNRLFILAAFFDSASLLLRPNAGPRAQVHFQALLQSTRLPAVHEQFHDQFTWAPRGAFAATAVAQILSAMQHRTVSVRALCVEVLGSCADDPDSGVRRESDGSFDFSPEVFNVFCAKRRAELPEAFWALEDALLTRFCQNHLIRLWPLWSSNLRSYGIGLFLRLAVIRFFLRHHPALRGAESDPVKVQALAVRVVYVLSRVFDHEGAILRKMNEHLVENELDTLSSIVSLLKF